MIPYKNRFAEIHSFDDIKHLEWTFESTGSCFEDSLVLGLNWGNLNWGVVHMNRSAHGPHSVFIDNNGQIIDGFILEGKHVGLIFSNLKQYLDYTGIILDYKIYSAKDAILCERLTEYIGPWSEKFYKTKNDIPQEVLRIINLTEQLGVYYDPENPMIVVKPGTFWKGKNEAIYEILNIANEYSNKPHCPNVVIYQDALGNIYAQEKSKFLQSKTLVAKD